MSDRIFDESKLVSVSLDNWLIDYCATGDELQVVKQDGFIFLINQRTKQIYVAAEIAEPTKEDFN